jgi:hypothetical protein
MLPKKSSLYKQIRCPARVYDKKIGGVAKKQRPKQYDVPTEIRRLARERVGAVPAPKLIVPKKQRKKPKYKRPPGEETE